MDRMSNSLALAASDRLLILAPHPDDESIATGGLIQVARDAGAATRVLVLTDGDNNPWPQRWIEKRWHIDAAARSRWGARRREEARTAMHVLGLHADDARFLGLPDLGLTDLLMRNDQAVIDTLRATIDEFRPTILVAPAETQPGAADTAADPPVASARRPRRPPAGGQGRDPTRSVRVHALDVGMYGSAAKRSTGKRLWRGGPREGCRDG